MLEPETEIKLMKPKTDLVFKKLFSKKELLIPFLNTTLELPEGEKIRSITFIDRALSGEFPRDKNTILDICVRDQSQQTYDVEIQCRNHKGFARRVVYYWSQLYLMQLQSGEHYKSLNKVVSIVITDFTMFDTPDYHSTFQFADLKKKLILTRVGKIHILELTKLPEEASISADPKVQWLYFLKRGHTMERETITRWNTPEIKEAYKELEKLSLNPKFRMEYLLRVKYLNDRVWELSESHDEGLEKGKELGEKSAKTRFALSLLNDGMEKKKIASLVGVSMEELNNLLPQDLEDFTDTSDS